MLKIFAHSIQIVCILQHMSPAAKNVTVCMSHSLTHPNVCLDVCVCCCAGYGGSAGGVAYVGSFAKSNGYYSPAFIFATSLYNNPK
jgi:hypothetical protein